MLVLDPLKLPGSLTHLCLSKPLSVAQVSGFFLEFCGCLKRQVVLDRKTIGKRWRWWAASQPASLHFIELGVKHVHGLMKLCSFQNGRETSGNVRCNSMDVIRQDPIGVMFLCVAPYRRDSH